MNGNYEYKYGYLVSGIHYDPTTNTCTYKGIEFKENETEQLEEYIGSEGYPYLYVKINGKKYYLKEGPLGFQSEIFYIDYTGERNYNQAAGTGNEENLKLYRTAIKSNKSAYEYYKDAYDFTKWVNDKLGGLQASSAKVINYTSGLGEEKSLEDVYGDDVIFEEGEDYEKANSNFNQHRMSVIKYSIETNLSTAIASFSSRAKTQFIMPKISDTDWDIIENDICTIGFVQGLPLGNKTYNSYAVVANTLTKEYVDEDDIYIGDGDSGIYYKANDSTLLDQSKVNLDNAIGYNKMDFEMKSYMNNGVKNYYYPIRLSTNTVKPYQGSYTSIFGYSGMNANNAIKTEACPDMYTYMDNLASNTVNNKLKKLYYTALGRERWGSYHVNNDIENKYFLKDYEGMHLWEYYDDNIHVCTNEGVPHTEEHSTYTVRMEATCTTPLREYSYCKICGRYFCGEGGTTIRSYRLRS